jgi:hypothetical protein
MKLTELDVIRSSLTQEMAQEMITTSRAITAEEASFAVKADPASGGSVIALSAAERGVLRTRFDVSRTPPTMEIEFVPWKSVRVSVGHRVTFGQPGAWSVRIARDDGPPIEVSANAGDQGWADFLRAVLGHANP